MKKELEKLFVEIKEIEDYSKINGIDLSYEKNLLLEKVKLLKKNISSDYDDYEILSLSRDIKRPTGLEYIDMMCKDFVELHGDRISYDDKSIVGGLCSIDGVRLMIVANQKGRSINEKIECRFGMATPSGFRKALRLFKLAEKFNLPIVTLVDTPGAYPGMEANDYGQSRAIAENLYELSTLKTPIISIVVGEGGSGGALAIALSDKLYMLEYATFSVITPEGCASILFHDKNKADISARLLHISSRKLEKLGLIDGIIDEPMPTYEADHKCIAFNLKKVILNSIYELKKIPIDNLLENRYNKYKNIGKYLGNKE